MDEYLKIKANRYTYTALHFTEDITADKINKFAGKDCVCRTRINGIGFNTKAYHAINQDGAETWFTPGMIMLKRSDGKLIIIEERAFNVLFNV